MSPVGMVTLVLALGIVMLVLGIEDCFGWEQRIILVPENSAAQATVAVSTN